MAKSCYTTFNMRNTRTLSVTLPPDMLKRAQSIAKRESRTMSELIREALRHYERRSWWDDINAYGRSKAGRQGIGEQDVDRLVHELRAAKRAAKK
jgi:CopG family transcriptional regulator / antitoxin EndoAI